MLIQKNLYKTNSRKGWYVSKSANDLMIEKVILIKSNEVLFYITSFVDAYQSAYVFLYKTEIVYEVYTKHKICYSKLENIFEILNLRPMLTK